MNEFFEMGVSGLNLVLLHLSFCGSGNTKELYLT